jgi:hypothetical protein
MDAVPVLQEPRRVHAGAAPDVEDAPGRGREVSTKDLTGPDQLQLGEAPDEAVLFPARLVVSNDGTEIVGHHVRP